MSIDDFPPKIEGIVSIVSKKIRVSDAAIVSNNAMKHHQILTDLRLAVYWSANLVKLAYTILKILRMKYSTTEVE